MSDYEARVVKAMVDLEGRVQEIQDPEYTTKYRLGGTAHVNTELPVDGEHYGWELEPILKKGLPNKPKYATDVHVCPNAKGDAHDHHTIYCGPTEMLKLDCGYWGAFAREREFTDPQREFGVIQGNEVWLCRFRSGGPHKNGTKLDHLPKTALIRKFIELVENSGKDFGFGIELVNHAVAVSSPATAGLVGDETLRIVFPDIHLPEKWPDPQPAPNPAPPANAREQLRDLLLRSQRMPLTPFNMMTAGQQQKIQDHLEAVHQYLLSPTGSPPMWSVTYKTGKINTVVTPVGVVAVPEVATYQYNPVMFLMEKAIVDRGLMSGSCWFICPSQDGKIDGVATPAVDLVNLLCAVEVLQKQEGASKVKVYQVGDLYELWMNREFLYREFPVSKAEAGSKGKLGLIRRVGQASDDFQYRMDKDWKLPSETATHPIKRYVYHEWPYGELIRRHQLFNSVGALRTQVAKDQGKSEDAVRGEVDTWVRRLRSLLAERVESVRSFSMADPGTDGSKKLKRRNPELFQGGYARKNARGDTEYLWNKMIIDKLAGLGFRKIYGNHDGYRGDPVLNSGISGVDQAESWISEDGVWIEHSHRWDDYNRDGMAFGAGVTNFVYYYYYWRIRKANQKLDSARVPWFLEPQEQASFMPGAAQWFLLVNFGKPGQFAGVKRFGVYASGHTHHADLCRIQFHLTLTARAKRTAEELKKEAEKKMDEAWQQLKDLPGKLPNLFPWK